MSKQEKKSTNLILQRSVGGDHPSNFREVVKDPENQFKVIGVIRRGSVTERGVEFPIYHLYDLKGQLWASERNRSFLEEKTAPKLQHELRQIAQERWREEELEKAREEKEPAKTKSRTNSRSKTKAKEEVER